MISFLFPVAARVMPVNQVSLPARATVRKRWGSAALLAGGGLLCSVPLRRRVHPLVMRAGDGPGVPRH